MENRRSRDRIICSVPPDSSGDGPDKLAGDNSQGNIPTISSISSSPARVYQSLPKRFGA